MDVQVALTKGVMAKMLKRHTKFSSGVRKKSCGNSSVFLDGRSPSDSKSHYDLLSKSRDGLKQIKVEKVTGRIPTEGPVNIPLSVWFPKKQRPHTANERQFHPEHNKNMSHEDVPTTGAPQSRKRSNSIIVKAEEPSEGRGSSNSSLVPLPILPTQGGHRANGFRISRPCSAELPQRRSGVKLIPTGYGGRVRRQQGHKGVGRNTMKISSAELVPRKDLPCEGNRYRISGRDQLMSTNVLSGDHPVYYVTADGQLAQVVKNEQQISKKGCDIETQTAVPIKSKEGFGKEEKPTEEKKPDQNTYTDNQGTNRKEQPYHPSRGVQQQQEMYYEPLERDGRDSRMASRNFCGQGGDASPRMGRLSQHIVFAKQWDVPLDSSTGRYPSGDFSPSSRHPNHLGQRHGCFEMSCSPSILMDQETFVSPKCSSYSSRPTTWRECENFCREGNVSRDVFKDEFPGERFAVSSSSSDHCIYGKDQFHRQKPRLQNAYHRLTEAVLKEFQLQQVQQFLSEKRCGVTPPKLKSFKHKRVKAIPMYCTGTHEEDLVAIDPSECRDCVQTKRRSPLDSKPLSKTKVKELVTLGGDPSPKDSRERLEKLEETGVPVSPYTTFPKDKSFVDVKDRESSISAALIREFPLKSDSLIHSATDVPDKIMKGERSGIEMQPGQKELCEKQSSLGRPSIKLTVKGSKDFGSSHSLDAPQYKLSREHLVSEDYGLRSKELSADYGLGSKDPAANAIGYEYGDFLKHETRQSTQGRKSSIYNKGEIPLDAQSLEVSKLRDSQRFSEPEQQFQPHQHRQSLAYPRSVQRFQSQRLQSQEYSQSEQRLQSQQHLQSRKQPEPHQHMNEPDRVSVPMESRDEETEPVNEILYPPQCTPQKPCDDSWGPMSKPNQTPRLRRRSYFYRKCVLGGMPLEGPHERARPKYQGNSGDSQSKTERSYERVQGEKQGQCCRKAPNRPASQQGPESRQNTLFRNGEKVENWNDCLCFRQPRPRGLPRIARGDALKKYFPLWCNYDSADADAEDTDMANNSSAEVLRKLYLNRDRTLVSFSSQPAGESAPESAQAISGGVVDKTESHKEETQSEEKPPLRYKKRSKKKSQDSTLSEKAVHDQQPKMTMATSSRNLQEQPNQDNLEGTSSMQWNIDDNENKTDQIDLQNERFCRILNPSSERKTAWVSSTKRPERSRLHRKSIKEKSKKPEEDLEGNQEKKHSIVGKDQKEKKPQRDSQENVEEAESSQVVLKTSSLKKVNKSANQPPLRTDDEPSKQAEKPTPPGSLIFQLAARYATFGGIRVAGGVRVLMDAPEKMGYVQIVSPLGQPFITHYINTMSFLQSASAAGVAWSAVIWDHAEEEAPKSKRPGRHGASDDHVVGKVDSAQVIFCEPYQAHRFRAVLETIKAAFSGGDGALVTPNVPPIPPACGRFNSCNPCLDLCNPGSCAVPCTPQQPLPTFPALPDPCGNPCQLPYPPLHQDPCGGNGVTACCAPPCCPPQSCFPQPSAPCAPPPFCTQLCCPPEPSCMPPCTNPCPIPLPTSCPGQCPTPNCCPDDCDPYAFANAYGKTLFCQLGCLVKLGKDEVWLEMNRGCVMVIQEPHCMGFSLALVNDKQVVLAVQKLSRKTDFKESPHTQHGFLYTAVSTTEKGSLHENFLVSFQSKAHADQFRNVVSGIKRVMAMSAGNISNSARITGISVCAPGVLRSCFDDVVETNDELRARMWDSCNMDGPCGVHRGGADPCEGGRDYSRRHDPSGGYKGSCGFESTGRGAPYNPHFDHKAKGYEYRFVGPRGFKHGHGRDNGRIGLHWDTGRLGNIAKMYGNGPEKGPGAKPGDAKTVSRQAGFANTADPASAAPASAAPASPEPKSEPVTVVPAKSTSQLTTTA